MRFSILTPTRDRQDFLTRCIESVQAQGFEDFEQIVFDNGERPVAVPDDPRIRYVRGTASGPAEAFSEALELARGDIVHPLSDDDRLAPGALAAVDEEIGRSEWLTGLTLIEGETWSILGRPCEYESLRESYYLGGAVYWRRSLSDRVGGFDTDFDGAADYELYLRFAAAASAHFLNLVLYRYTDHADTDSRRNPERQAEVTARIINS